MAHSLTAMSQQISSTTELIASKLEPIRVIIWHLHSALNWEKPYHAPLLTFAVTSIFMLLWLIDTSVLSKLCITAILVIIIDLILPTLNGIIAPKKWLDEHEAKFKNFCLRSAITWYQFHSFYEGFFKMKRTNTKTFYGSFLTFLLIVAWIGNIVHNLLLTYLIVLLIVLYPGLSKQESFKQYILDITMRISALFPHTPKPKEK